jgi:hypothetical protein
VPTLDRGLFQFGRRRDPEPESAPAATPQAAAQQPAGKKAIPLPMAGVSR